MALPSPAEQLRAAASCPVCLELFRDPVSLRCGHNFCRGCVERCGPGPGAAAGPLCCPQCRDAAPGGGSSSLRPSRELGHIAGIARELLPALLPAPPPGAPGDGSVCGRHREPLRLFCREERALLCAECARERRERHREQHREQDREQAWGHSAWGQPGWGQARGEGQHLVREFRELRRSLEEQQRLLLAQLGDLEAAIGRGRDQAVEKVSEELSQLDTLIWEMEGKFQQPPGRFLQVGDPGREKGGMNKIQNSAPKSSPQELPWCHCWVGQSWDTAGKWFGVTLDPLTAHPRLVLSPDSLSARWAYGGPEPEPGPERFSCSPCALGLPGFTGGRHTWTVALAEGPFCAAGVSRASVRRHGPACAPADGVWALQRWGGLCRALTEPAPTPLPGRCPRHLRVALDYDGGRVAFFDGDDGPGQARPLFAFPTAEFGGEEVRPWFWLELGEISIVQ
uniref:TRI27 protein n=1 Tax=Junco hyemalis TaxID=40217 RepID=A0A8C5IER1_JUNHY